MRRIGFSVGVIAAFGWITCSLVAGAAMAKPFGEAATPQMQTSLAGKYEATLKDASGEVKVSLEITQDAGKYAANLTTQKGTFKLTGQMIQGALVLKSDPKDGRHEITLRQKDDLLVANIVDGGAPPINTEFHRVVADEISGEWDAVADAQGQAFPFTLTLKVDGEKVTGSSNSQLGTSTISSGTWKDGKLSFVLEGGSGQVVMAAVIVDGKLSGDFDFAGQMSGKWVAQKKK